MSGYNLQQLHKKTQDVQCSSRGAHKEARHIETKCIWSDPAVARLKDRRVPLDSHLNCNVITATVVVWFGRPSKQLLCKRVCKTINLMRPRERRKVAPVCYTGNQWHVVMKLCDSLYENKALCHLPTVSSSSLGLCSPKLNLLEFAFNAPVPELWWAELFSAVLQAAQKKWRDFTLWRQCSSCINHTRLLAFSFRMTVKRTWFPLPIIEWNAIMR